ncbi:MAG: UDP-N-acetylmuramate dehydrogenase [Methylophilaceae bacterium]|nr:MAG: UDP-N-acetylmuramate dehydrogenase [Methylophilaceae bacterium]
MAQTQAQGTLLMNESMARYNSWRIGGKADRLYIPSSLDDLSAFLQSLDAEEPVNFVGLGSNLLVRDDGVRGTVVVLHNALNRLQMEGNLIYADAGVTCAKLARFTAKQAKQGGEFWAGIPGTVGGALSMNAGCHGGETWDSVHRVLTIDLKGTVHERNATEFVVAYRHVEMPVVNEWYVGAWFNLAVGDPEVSEQKIKTLLAKRLETQPLNLPNAGSTFRNPEGDYAARLVEACGLKGHMIGGAQISEKHANFIVNLGNATAHDIEQLIDLMRDQVKEKFGISLQQEVHVLGNKVGGAE